MDYPYCFQHLERASFLTMKDGKKVRGFGLKELKPQRKDDKAHTAPLRWYTTPRYYVRHTQTLFSVIFHAFPSPLDSISYQEMGWCLAVYPGQRVYEG